MAWLPGHGACWQGCCGCRCALPVLPCCRGTRAAGLSLCLLLLLLRLLQLLLPWLLLLLLLLL